MSQEVVEVAKAGFDWSLVVASAAFVVSVATAYWNLWRPVRLKMKLPNDIFVSNTLGGVPDARVSLSFSAIGSPANTTVIQRISLSLTNTITKKQIELEALRDDDGNRLPIIMHGRTTENRRFMFVVNDYVPDEVKRFEEWCNQIEHCVTDDKKDEVSKYKLALRDMALGNEPEVEQEESENGGTIDIETALKQKLGLRYHARKYLERAFIDLIEGMESDKLEKILFITSGPYNGHVKIFDDADILISEGKFSFDVDSILSETLKRKFNTNVRVRVKAQ